jgi:hypothetical protein
VVAQDELNESGALRSLYASSAFATFAANIVGVEKLHVMGDELAGCTGEILREGQVGRSLFSFFHFFFSANHYYILNSCVDTRLDV